MTESPGTAHTNSSSITVASSNFSTRPAMGHTPMSSVPPSSFAAGLRERSHAKSPSLPILRHYPSSPGSTDPGSKGNPIPPPSPRRAETSTALSSFLTPSSTTSAATSGVSKRSHLLREIATSERAYARDLKLVRDAYMGPHLQQFREGSLSSVSSSASVSTTGSDKSKRRPMYTFHTQSLSISQTPSVKGEGLPKSPSEGMNLALQSTPSSRGTMSPPVGKPLSPADVKVIFLNLDQLAAVAEELAMKFEEAVGEEEEEGRDGEGGNDRMGEVFVSMVRHGKKKKWLNNVDRFSIRCRNSNRCIATFALANRQPRAICRRSNPILLTLPTSHNGGLPFPLKRALGTSTLCSLNLFNESPSIRYCLKIS